MKDIETKLYLRHRLNWRESIEQRHSEVMSRLQEVGPPFGLRNLRPPSTPDFGQELVASYDLLYPIPGVSAHGIYRFRQQGYGEDIAGYDDFVLIQFKLSNKRLNYSFILHENFPELISAFCGYQAKAIYGRYGFWYGGGGTRENENYNRLKAEKSLDVDGHNNIFTLQTAMYWDALLCQRALGYDRDEVISRLQGKVPLVMPLMDGVYTVFNDDPDLSYEEFVAYNDRLKPVLGLL